MISDKNNDTHAIWRMVQGLIQPSQLKNVIKNQGSGAELNLWQQKHWQKHKLHFQQLRADNKPIQSFFIILFEAIGSSYKLPNGSESADTAHTLRGLSLYWGNMEEASFVKGGLYIMNSDMTERWVSLPHLHKLQPRTKIQRIPSLEQTT